MASSSVWEDINESFNSNFGPLNSVALTRGDATSYGSAVIVSLQGEMLALGENKNGCLGINSDETRVPLKVQEIALVSGVSVCDRFGDAVAYTKEGKLYHWGANVHGNTCKKPVLIGGLPNIIDARCARGHYLALTQDGKIYEWRGTITYDNKLDTLGTTPTAVVLKDDIVSIACGPYHSLAVSKLGEVYSFGLKSLPNESLLKQPVTRIPLPKETVVKVACGLRHSLVLTKSGKIYTWGHNWHYLGDDKGKIHWSDSPLQVGGKIGRFVDIATNGDVTNAAITDTGAVYTWGKEGEGYVLLSPTLTKHTELQQVFSNICPSNCSWIYKDSYSVTHEDPALLGMEMASTFNVKDFSDLTLLVGNKAIYVHKYVLHLRSQFFRIWLQERWTDKSKRELELTSYDYDIYLSYLWFLYSGEIKTSPQHILELWDLAVVYGEEKLKLGCQNLISKNMSMETLLHKSRTMRHRLSDIENGNPKPLEDKINEIEANYESQCQRVREEYVSALKKLKNEYKVAQGKDASQLARLSALLESEDLNTEQAAVGSELEIEVAKLEENLLKPEKSSLELVAENLELRDLRNKLEQKLSKLEEDNLKLRKVISKLRSDQTSAKMDGKNLDSDPTILQQPFKIERHNSTNPELTRVETTEKKYVEKVDIEKLETVKTKVIHTKRQVCESEIQETENKVNKNYFEIAEIYRKGERSYEELLEDYIELEKWYRELESEKSNLEEDYNRLQEKHKKLKDFLLRQY